jgi:dTMP kinase
MKVAAGKSYILKEAPINQIFLVLEGLDGAGTTTQGRLLRERFIKENIPCVLTSEPTEKFLGRTIRAILQGTEEVDPSTMPLLFAADRNEHLYGRGGILESLERGEVVICDRYIFSSLAYQAIDNDFEKVRLLNAEFPLPEILIFLTVSPETGDDRLVSREKREIYEVLDFQRRVEKSYERAIAAYSDSGMRILRLDGTRRPELIHEEIWSFCRKNRY